MKDNLKGLLKWKTDSSYYLCDGKRHIYVSSTLHYIGDAIPYGKKNLAALREKTSFSLPYEFLRGDTKLETES